MLPGASDDDVSYGALHSRESGPARNPPS
jgi:hypothetical protein